QAALRGREPAGDDDRAAALGANPGARASRGSSRGAGSRAAEGDGPRGQRALRDGARVRGGVARVDQLIVRRALRGALIAGALCAGALAAQEPRLAQPSRADSLLAQGRLAAAEAALYAASDAKPRDPAARGALAAYLASRGRFPIALVLFDEAQRFGADPARVNLARAAIRPYTRAAAAGPETTVPLRAPRVVGSLGVIAVRRTRGA